MSQKSSSSRSSSPPMPRDQEHTQTLNPNKTPVLLRNGPPSYVGGQGYGDGGSRTGSFSITTPVYQQITGPITMLQIFSQPGEYNINVAYRPESQTRFSFIQPQASKESGGVNYGLYSPNYSTSQRK